MTVNKEVKPLMILGQLDPENPRVPMRGTRVYGRRVPSIGEIVTVGYHMKYGSQNIECEYAGDGVFVPVNIGPFYNGYLFSGFVAGPNITHNSDNPEYYFGKYAPVEVQND